MTSPTTSLTEEQVASFHREGYLVLDAITTQGEVARLRLIYDRLFSDKIGWASGNQFDLAGTDEGDQATLPQLLGPSQYAPELKETRYLRNAQGMARQLLGEEMLPRNGEHMIYKPPAIGAATPWHQDQAYWGGAPKYSAWIALEDATLENGCLKVIPGSHRSALDHAAVQDKNGFGNRILDEDLKNETIVDAPLNAGDALIFHDCLLHGSHPNLSGRDRWSHLPQRRPPRSLHRLVHLKTYRPL